MIKLKDVANRAGVSEATASLVMNKRKGVKEETREKVLKAARKLGYNPNSIARGLAMQKSHTIGLVVTDIENPFFGSVTRYINENIRDEGYNLILSVSNDNLQREQEIINEFIHKRVDGVIVIPTQFPREDFSLFADLKRHDIPYVFSTTYYEEVTGDCVMTDLEAGSYKLTCYLLELGHKKIMFLVSCNRDVLISKLRISGYKKAFQEKGLSWNKDWIIECEMNDFHHGYINTARILKEKEKPDTVIAINDIMALGAMKAIREAGYKIPADISVAGYDDVVFSSIAETPLTTVKQDIPEICSQTVDILLDKINDEHSFRGIKTIKPELTIRESTGKCDH